MQPEERYRRVAERAYLLAEAAGFPPERDLEFWLAAEQAEATTTAVPDTCGPTPAKKTKKKT
jgi:hypothetical protein